MAKKKTETVLKDPEQLERIASLRDKLLGTDRDDHLRELDRWEAEVKKSLILLSLNGHEGVKRLRFRAEREIYEINTVLRTDKPKDLSPESALKFAYETSLLHAKREMWVWFINLFLEAKEQISATDSFLDSQEEDPLETGDYVGAN